MLKNIISVTCKLLGEILGWCTGNVEKMFLIVFLTTGLLFVFIVPPFQNPDEPMHFYRSYQVAMGNMAAESNNEGLYGGQVPIAMQQMVIDSGIEHNYDYGYKFDTNYTKLLGYKYGGRDAFEAFPNTAIYSPVAYLPAAGAHLVGMLLNLPILVVLYLARLLSLILVGCAIFFAIKTTPLGKWIIFTIGLLPMMVASASSVSSDAMTTAVSILFIALTLHIALNRGLVRSRYFIILIITTLLVCLVKQAHVALLPLLFLIPLLNKEYRSKKLILILLCTVVIALVCFFVWYIKISPIVINFDPTISPDAQKTFILHHPHAFLSVLCNTYLTNYGNGTIIGIFGNFGWLTATLPTIFIIFSSLTLFLSVQVREKGERNIQRMTQLEKNTFRSVNIGVFLLVAILISTALYMYWTPYKNAFIMGIQGRYFLPILPLLLIPFLGGVSSKQAFVKRFIIITVCIILWAAVYTVYQRFYV